LKMWPLICVGVVDVRVADHQSVPRTASSSSWCSAA
jgi:hypothetical protein